MQTLIEDSGSWRRKRELQSRLGRGNRQALGILLLASAVILLSSCGSSGSAGSQPSATLAGNWQFTMAAQSDGNPSDPTFGGGLQGGFLQQNNGSFSGQTTYSVTSSTSATGPCNSGSAPVTITVSGQNVTLTEVAGTQTFTLTGSLSADQSTMTGTYTSTAGTAADGSACGYAETGLSWSAVSVPSLTGSISGSFHSTSGNSGLSDQDFLVSGSLTQGENVGASNATITGTLSFIDPTSNLSDYPCFSIASVNGQISGNSVILQIIGTSGITVGQIGAPSGSPTGVQPVTLDSAQGGYILHGTGPSYLVETPACTGGGSLADTTVAGDSGNICLGLNSTSTCQQPITLSPAEIAFPGQTLGAAAQTQTITVTNNSSSSLNLNLSFTISNNTAFRYGTQLLYSDFNGVPNFSAQDTCVPGEVLSPSGTAGTPFSLGPGASCTAVVTFTPQESCPWLPFALAGTGQSISGASPEYCPFPLDASLVVNSPVSADSDNKFAVPITGIGLSAIRPSTAELDFGAEEQLHPPEASLPQSLSFTNTSPNPVEILEGAACVGGILPHPVQTRPVAGLQVVANYSGIANFITPDVTTIIYSCDTDPGTFLPNFQISSDTCSGTTLAPQASCSLSIAYVPQPNTDVGDGLDAFVELNTLQCAGGVPSEATPCEIDSGRFPVELKTNGPSPLRMSPGAGLDFGTQSAGKKSAAQTVTLLNDPDLASPQTVTFVGKIQVSGNYSESDDCPAALAPGSSCTLSVIFKPGGVGFSPGTITINYTPEPTGQGQFVYLRGTGQ